MTRGLAIPTLNKDIGRHTRDKKGSVRSLLVYVALLLVFLAFSIILLSQGHFHVNCEVYLLSIDPSYLVPQLKVKT